MFRVFRLEKLPNGRWLVFDYCPEMARHHSEELSLEKWDEPEDVTLQLKG